MKYHLALGMDQMALMAIDWQPVVSYATIMPYMVVSHARSIMNIHERSELSHYEAKQPIATKLN